jgi:ABC-2 type transport system ATP-binding protein
MARKGRRVNRRAAEPQPHDPSWSIKGRSPGELWHNRSVEQTRPLGAFAVRCTGLVKRYADVVAVAGLDLEVRVGECFGLLGPNGAGKTTTVEILEGLLSPDAGHVEVLGTKWGDDDLALRERLGIQLQETRLNERLTVEETLKLFRSFYRRGRTIDEVLRLVELEHKRSSWVGKLSGGQRQRLAVACALLNHPDLLFLDEPTTGLDPQSRRQVWSILDRFRREGGTILLTTHAMDEAETLCDRVAVMDLGKVIALGTPAELICTLGAEHIVEFALQGGVSSSLLLRLRGLPGVREVRADNGTVSLTATEVHLAVPALVTELDHQGAHLSLLATHHATLEDVFVALTGRRLRDG